MKILIISLSLWSYFFFPLQNTEKVFQYLPLNKLTTSVVIDLDGEVEVVFWAKEKLLVETKIATESIFEKALDYAIQKGHFQLETSLGKNEQEMTIKSKRINTMILVKGQKQKTTQHYRIFIPERLQFYQR